MNFTPARFHHAAPRFETQMQDKPEYPQPPNTDIPSKVWLRRFLRPTNLKCRSRAAASLECTAFQSILLDLTLCGLKVVSWPSLSLTITMRSNKRNIKQEKMEASPGIEPGYADLQSAASPLRHEAFVTLAERGVDGIVSRGKVNLQLTSLLVFSFCFFTKLFAIRSSDFPFSVLPKLVY